MKYFFGALYLFSINSVYICLASFMIVRLLRFKKISSTNPKVELRMRRTFFVLALTTLLPSTFIAYQLVRKEVISVAIRDFIQAEIQNQGIQVFTQSLDKARGIYRLKLTLLNPPKEEDFGKKLEKKLADYGLNDLEIDLQDVLPGAKQPDLASLKTGVIEELFKKNEQKIQNLTQQLEQFQSQAVPVEEISKEIVIEHPAIKQIVLAQQNSELLGYIASSKNLKPEEQLRIKAWLTTRTKSKDAHILFKRF